MKKIHRITYQVPSKTLEETILLAFELQDNTGMEPATLVLPDGREIPWNKEAAHEFAGNGTISEEEFIELSLSNK